MLHLLSVTVCQKRVCLTWGQARPHNESIESHDSRSSKSGQTMNQSKLMILPPPPPHDSRLPVSGDTMNQSNLTILAPKSQVTQWANQISPISPLRMLPRQIRRGLSGVVQLGLPGQFVWLQYRNLCRLPGQYGGRPVWPGLVALWIVKFSCSYRIYWCRYGNVVFILLLCYNYGNQF